MNDLQAILKRLKDQITQQATALPQNVGNAIQQTRTALQPIGNALQQSPLNAPAQLGQRVGQMIPQQSPFGQIQRRNFQNVIPAIQNEVNKSPYFNPQIPKLSTGQIKPYSTWAPQEQNQFAQGGLNIAMQSFSPIKSMPGGQFNQATNMLRSITNDRTFRDNLGRIGAIIKSGRGNLKQDGEYLQSLGETLFGKEATVGLNTKQLYNAIDLAFEQASKNPTVSWGIGLGTKNVRGKMPPLNQGGGVSGKLPQSEPLATLKKVLPEQSPPASPVAGGALPNGQVPPSSNQTIDPVQKIINALKGAKPIRGEQEKIYSKIRSQQAGALAGIGQQMKGEAGFYQKLGQLKGELPKVSFETIRKEFTQTELDSLFNKIEASPLTPFEKITAQGGFKKLLGAEGGVIPNKSELALLNEIFPPELTQALLDKRDLVSKLFSLGESALNLPRAMMATADLSAPLRQGIFLIGRPKQWVPAFKDMFKYAFSENAYKGLSEQIKARPTYPLMREAKLAITDMSPVLQNREEMFMSNLSEKIPIFGSIAKGSNRAYSGFLNKLRADTFDDLVKSAKSTGLEVDGKLLSDIGNFVNTATGRGNLGALQSAATVLNGAFFSPRLMASRLSLLNPLYYVKLDPFVRKEALKSLITFAGTAGTVFGLAKLGGLDVGTDPRSADFLKIKTGDTRYDVLGGFQQYMVLGARLLSGEMVSSTTGKEMQLGEGYNTPTRADIIANFLKNKESPVLSFITSLASGKDALGQKINIPTEVIDMFIPMLAQGIADLQKEDPGLKSLGMAVPGIFGTGVQTYTDQIPMEGKTATGRPNVQWRQQPSLGEDILNKITGTQVSTIPQDQWAPLAEARKNEQLWKIQLDSVKKGVLTTGEEQMIKNPISGADIRIYLDNGVVKTKDLTPKTTKAKTATIKKATVKKTSVKKSAKITIKKTPTVKISMPKLQSTKYTVAKPASIKIAKGTTATVKNPTFKIKKATVKFKKVKYA